jgi:hypothetical protein
MFYSSILLILSIKTTDSLYAQNGAFWANFATTAADGDDFLVYSHRNANMSGGFHQTKKNIRPAFPDTIISDINPLSVYDVTQIYMRKYAAPCSFTQEYITQSGFYRYRYYSAYGNKLLTDSVYFVVSTADTIIIEPPVDTAIVNPPVDTSAIVPPVDTSAIIPPVDTSAIVPPVDTSAIIPPVDTSAIVPPVDTSAIIPPVDTSAIIPPVDTSAIIPPADTIISDSDTADARAFKIVNLIVVDEYELTYLKVINLDHFTNVELRVFSSRGEQIYYTKDYRNELNMKPFRDGTYYYFISGVDKDNYKYQTGKGFVQLYHKL